ncbi:MAG: hypothetical protein ACE5G9_08950 [Nitrospinales bacterium]
MKCFLRLLSLTAIFLFLVEGILPGIFHNLLPTAEAAKCAFAGTVDDSTPCDAGLSTEVKDNLGDNAVTTCSAINFSGGASASSIDGTIENGFCPGTPLVPALSFPTAPAFPSPVDKDDDKDKNKDKEKGKGGGNNNQSDDFDSPSSEITEFHEGDDCPSGWPDFDFFTHTDANGFLVGASPFQFCKMELKNTQLVQTSPDDVVWVFKDLKLKDNSQLIITGDATFNVREEVEVENNAQMIIGGITTFNVLKEMEFKDDATVQVNGWLTAWIYDKFEMEDRSVLSITGDASINAKNKAEFKDDARIDLLEGTLTLQTDGKFEMKNNAAINQTNGRPSQALVLAGLSAELRDNAVFVGALATNGKIELKNNASVIGSLLGDSMDMKDSSTVGFRTGSGSDTKGFSCVVFTDADPGDVSPVNIDTTGFTFGPIGEGGCTIDIPCVGTNLDRLKIIYHREFLGTFAACNPTLPPGDPLGCDGVRNNPEANGVIDIPTFFLSQGITGTNIKVAALSPGQTSCTINIDEAPWDNTDCGYRVSIARTGTMLKIETKPRNGALNCLMKFSVLTPKTFHIQEEADDSEIEEAVINEHSMVDDPFAGIVGNRGHAVILGMTGRVNTRTTSGNIFADLTSDNVRMKSLTGDSWAQGLTQKGYFRSWGGGNLRINYCQAPQDTPGKNLTLFARQGVLSPLAGDSTIRFPTTAANQVFESLVTVTDPINQFKNLLGNCAMCLFKVQGKAEGGLIITGKTGESCKF